LGESQLCLEQLENARSSFQNVLDLHPQNQFVLNAMGLTVYRIMGEDASAAAAAEEYFVRSFEADPAYWYPLFNLLSLRHADDSKNVMYAKRFLALYEQLGTLPPILTLPTLPPYPEFVYVMYAHAILAHAYSTTLPNARLAFKHYEIAHSIFEKHHAEIAAIEGLQWAHRITYGLERVKREWGEFIK
jgi:tetratricopeptide (TPR) repeat protein